VVCNVGIAVGSGAAAFAGIIAEDGLLYFRGGLRAVASEPGRPATGPNLA
jgi:hypothetical protein